MNEEMIEVMTNMQWFLLILGQLIINLIIKYANQNLTLEKLIDREEFLRFISLWLLMSIIGSGFGKIEYWSHTLPCAENSVSFSFNEWMSKNWSKGIQNILQYTNKNPPTYKDKFYSIRNLIKLQNENIEKIFE